MFSETAYPSSFFQSVTHDRQNPFRVEFDDPSWQSYLNYLKPLGLGILLNTCNVSTEEKYTNFFNHLVCESIRVEDEAAAGRATDQVRLEKTEMFRM